MPARLEESGGLGVARPHPDRPRRADLGVGVGDLVVCLASAPALRQTTLFATPAPAPPARWPRARRPARWCARPPTRAPQRRRERDSPPTTRSIIAPLWRTRVGSAMRELPVPAHFDAGPRGRGVAGGLRAAGTRRRRLGRRARDPAGVRRLAARLPARGGRAEHVLRPGLRAVRGRPLGHRRRGRQPPALRVRLPEPRDDHPGLPQPRHAPRDAGVPRHLAGGRAGEPSRPVHAGLARGRRVRPLAGERGGRGGARARPGLRGAPPRPLHAGAVRRREVRPHDLAVPRHARRHRARAGVGGRGGALLPLDRALQPARLPGEGRQAAHRALLDAGAGGDRGTGRRAARPLQRRR